MDNKSEMTHLPMAHCNLDFDKRARNGTSCWDFTPKIIDSQENDYPVTTYLEQNKTQS